MVESYLVVAAGFIFLGFGGCQWTEAIEFEMTYQARFAIDPIRFAIKHREQGTHQPEQPVSNSQIDSSLDSSGRY